MAAVPCPFHRHPPAVMTGRHGTPPFLRAYNPFWAFVWSTTEEPCPAMHVRLLTELQRKEGLKIGATMAAPFGTLFWKGCRGLGFLPVSEVPGMRFLPDVPVAQTGP
uniref:Uncharacterized protein n=1 Tax=Eutreptiella gymnastica TaxID=73025 RepID=A0A7S1IJD3_9EUGL